MKIALANLEFIDPLLREMALEVERHFGEQTVTSLYRIGDNGVHGTLPLRGMDLRQRNAAMGEEISAYINRKFIYDKHRPQMKCAMYHDVGQGAHIHLQVHPNSFRQA